MGNVPVRFLQQQDCLMTTLRFLILAPRSPAGELSTKAFDIHFGEQLERRFEQNASPRTTRPQASLLEKRSVVAVVFCRQLWWCSDGHPQGLHRAAKDAALTVNGGLISPPCRARFYAHTDKVGISRAL